MDVLLTIFNGLIVIFMVLFFIFMMLSCVILHRIGTLRKYEIDNKKKAPR